MNISAKKVTIAAATILLSIVATLFWPGSNAPVQKDNTIGAASLMPERQNDAPPAAAQRSESDAQRQAPTPDSRNLAVVTTEDGAFTVQVSSWRSRWKAERERRRFEEQGFDAYLQRVHIPEKGGVWHRVRLGRFATAEMATRQAEAVQDMLQAGFWIATR